MRNEQQAPTVPLEAFTVELFCKAHNVGKSTLYELWKEGKGPKVFYVKSSPRISKEAAAQWRREREAESNRAA